MKINRGCVIIFDPTPRIFQEKELDKKCSFTSLDVVQFQTLTEKIYVSYHRKVNTVNQKFPVTDENIIFQTF